MVEVDVDCDRLMRLLTRSLSLSLCLLLPSIPPTMPCPILILSANDVSSLLRSPSTLALAIESQSKAFVAYSRSQIPQAPTKGSDNHGPATIQAPLRTTLTSRQITTLVMPARADAEAGLGGIGVKMVSVPNDSSDGLPATTTVFDETTGNLRAVINARSLTALRNACGMCTRIKADDQSMCP
jgi:ornithine cyclodeaminase/alanine dehydrogenase-like protein (mu-crystallin family)